MHSAMEQTRYWMWTKRKLSGRPLLNSVTPPVVAAATGGSSYHGSWEEQAFAEDSAGHLGGCVWPPRSYLCSFCRREFRSAQALGGHMNVHRRDRARLKQSSSSPSNENHDADLHHHMNPCTLLGTQYPSQVSTLVYSSNSNPNLGVISSTHCPSRVSAPCTQESFSNCTLVSPSCPPSIIERCRMESVLSNPQPISDLLPIGPLTVLELKLGRENWRLREVDCEDDEETISRKRRKTDPIFPLFMKPSLGDQELLQSETKKLKPSHIEELDLELRLGDPPKVK